MDIVFDESSDFTDLIDFGDFTIDEEKDLSDEFEYDNKYNVEISESDKDELEASQGQLSRETLKFYNVMKLSIYSFSNSVRQSLLKYIESIPRIEILSADVLIEAILFRQYKGTLNQTNFMSFMVEDLKNRSVSEIDLIRYIRYLDMVKSY